MIGFVKIFCLYWLLILNMINHAFTFYNSKTDAIDVLDHESIKTVLDNDHFTWIEVIITLVEIFKKFFLFFIFLNLLYYQWVCIFMSFFISYKLI